jgi:hypothetical protein
MIGQKGNGVMETDDILYERIKERKFKINNSAMNFSLLK